MSKGYQDLYDKLPCEFTIDDIIMLKSHCNSLNKENEELTEDNKTLTQLVWLKYGTSLNDETTKSFLDKYEEECHCMFAEKEKALAENQILKDGINEFLKKFEIEQWEINEDDYNIKIIDFQLKEEAEHHSGFVGLISISALEDGYNKIKEMIEVVENDKKEEQEND